MPYIANGIGILAVILFVASYQIKKRSGIILCNAISRALYIVQYLMLLAFEGAVLDVLGLISSVLAQRKDSARMQRWKFPLFLIVNGAIITAGVLLWRDIFSLFPIIGVLLHTNAFWISDEKRIRLMSFFGSPFWLVYNLKCFAIGSAIGDAMTIVSIGLAILRYDILKKENAK